MVKISHLSQLVDGVEANLCGAIPVAFWSASFPEVTNEVHCVEVETDDRYDFVASMAKMVKSQQSLTSGCGCS